MSHKSTRKRILSEHTQWRVISKLRKAMDPWRIAAEEHVPVKIVKQMATQLEHGGD